MSSGNRSLPRPRYSRPRRAAIVAACASALTGAAVALPAATFAGEADDTPPIASLDLAGTIVDVPDAGVPLPDVEADTDHLPVATVTEALGLTLAVDTSPKEADTERTTEPTTTAPAPAVPTSSGPTGTLLITTDPATPEPTNTEPAATEPTTTEPTWDVPTSDELQSASDPASDPAPVSAAPAGDAIRTSSGRSAPASAVATPARTTRVAKARPVAKREVSSRVLEAQAPSQAPSQAQAPAQAPARRQVEPPPALSTAEVVGTDQVGSATRGGLGLTAPLTDLGPQPGTETMNLTSRSGPDSATGDWNLLPEALYAVAPLLLAGAAVMTHGRRNARVAATSGVVVRRRRHASVG